MIGPRLSERQSEQEAVSPARDGRRFLNFISAKVRFWLVVDGGFGWQPEAICQGTLSLLREGETRLTSNVGDVHGEIGYHIFGCPATIFKSDQVR